MSWFKAIAFSALLAVAACGFQPMYGDNAKSAATAAQLGSVEIDNIPDRDGQSLRNALIDRLYTDGRPADAPYILRMTDFKNEVTSMGIQKDASYTRAEIRFTAKMQLIDRATNKPVLERDLRAVGSYNLLDNQYATLTSESDVAQNLLNEMADNVVTQLGLYFNRADMPGSP